MQHFTHTTVENIRKHELDYHHTQPLNRTIFCPVKRTRELGANIIIIITTLTFVQGGSLLGGSTNGDKFRLERTSVRKNVKILNYFASAIEKTFIDKHTW